MWRYGSVDLQRKETPCHKSLTDKREHTVCLRGSPQKRVRALIEGTASTSHWYAAGIDVEL